MCDGLYSNSKVCEKVKRNSPEDTFDLDKRQKTIWYGSFSSQGKPRFSLLSLKSYIEVFLARTIRLRGKIVDTPESLFCGATDNLVHFFITCPTVHEFLGRIQK